MALLWPHWEFNLRRPRNIAVHKRDFAGWLLPVPISPCGPTLVASILAPAPAAVSTPAITAAIAATARAAAALTAAALAAATRAAPTLVSRFRQSLL